MSAKKEVAAPEVVAVIAGDVDHVDVDHVEMVSLRADGTPDQTPGHVVISE
jgi:hypothetical protein